MRILWLERTRLLKHEQGQSNREGDLEGALEAIDESVFRTDWRRANRHLIYGLQNNILIKAEVLAEMGRLEDALRTYEAMRSSNNRISLPYYGLVYYRSGQLLEQLDRGGEAMEMYARLIRLWKDADDPYLRYVDAAAERLDRLAAESTPEPA